MGAAADGFARARRVFGYARRPNPRQRINVTLPCNDSPRPQRDREASMEHTMTVTEILDALYDGIGCSWVEEGRSFVDEVAAWAETTRAHEDGDED